MLGKKCGSDAHISTNCHYFSGPRKAHRDAWTNYGKADPRKLFGEVCASSVVCFGRAIEQPGDGNCLYHALAYAIGRSDHASLRRQIAAFVKRNPCLEVNGESLAQWVWWDSAKAVNDYCDDMAISGWGGGIELAAFSAEEKFSIHVYEECGSSGCFSRLVAFDSPAPVRLVNLLYKGGVHYDGLELTEASHPEASVHTKRQDVNADAPVSTPLPPAKTPASITADPKTLLPSMQVVVAVGGADDIDQRRANIMELLSGISNLRGLERIELAVRTELEHSIGAVVPAGKLCIKGLVAKTEGQTAADFNALKQGVKEHFRQLTSRWKQSPLSSPQTASWTNTTFLGPTCSFCLRARSGVGLFITQVFAQDADCVGHCFGF